jgi:hypothetical protein
MHVTHVTLQKDGDQRSLNGVTSRQLSVTDDTGLAVATGGLHDEALITITILLV